MGSGKMKNKRIYFWRCFHDVGAGKDRECCAAQGKLSCLKTAIKNGQKHNQSHRYCGWGYAPSGWSNQTVTIYRKTPKGKWRVAVSYDKLNEK